MATFNGTGSPANLVLLDPTGMANVTATDVQSAVAELDAAVGGGGGGEDLAATLAIGNTTGGNDLIVSTGDSVKAPDNPAGAGGSLQLSGGDGGGGSVDGGDIILTPGAGAGAGADGEVFIQSSLNVSSTSLMDGYVGILEGTTIPTLASTRGIYWVRDFNETAGNGGYYTGADGRTYPAGAGPWAGVVLHPEQFLKSGSAISLAQATMFTLTSLPTSGDTLSITDGSTTRTYGADAGGDVQYVIAGTIADTLTNLAAAISGDGSGLWSAVKTLSVSGFGNGVVVIYRTAQAVDSYTDRLYGTFTLPSSASHWDYGTFPDYRVHPGASSTISSQLPSVDPAAKTFGFGVRNASLLDADTFTTAFGGLTVRAEKYRSTAFWRKLGSEDSANTVYLAKHGNDNSSGLTPENPKLTLSGANTTAGTLFPTITNPVTIHVLDTGEYSGTTLTDFVSLHAPQAVFTTSLIFGNGTANKIFAFRSTSGAMTISSGETAWLDVEEIEVNTISVGISVAGIGYLHVKHIITTSTSAGISVGVSGTCFAHVDRIQIGVDSGNGITNSGVFKGFVGDIDDGGFSGVFAFTANGTTHLVANRISGSGAAITGSGTCSVQVGELVGPILGVGTRIYGGAYRPANGTHWTDPDPTTVGEALDRIAAAVFAGTSGTIA